MGGGGGGMCLCPHQSRKQTYTLGAIAPRAKAALNAKDGHTKYWYY